MFKRLIASLVCLTFIFSNLQYVHAQDFSINQLPVPGSMIGVTPAYVPLTLKGMVIHPENALKFDFLMDTGHSNLEGNDLSEEALKIMKYFLTALTIPEDDLWVNLSPYEKGRVVQDNFGQTMMGRDLLAEDYVLKQLTASLIYPEKALGKKFWQQVYSKAAKEYGTTQIPVNTFNKVWIVPSEAVVWEHENKVLIVKSHLKVMLEEDYLSMKKKQLFVGDPDKAHTLGSQTIRDIVLPVLEKEVNEGKNFFQLRQMYQAMILATWYKKVLKESLLAKIYADKGKIAGLIIPASSSVIPAKAGIQKTGSPIKTFGDDIDSMDVNVIYQRYLKAFKKGVFNYIKEDKRPNSFGSDSGDQPIVRKYFSGGFSLDGAMTAKGTTFNNTVLKEWKGDLLSLPTNERHDLKAATGNIGTTILVEGNFTKVGPGASKEQTQDAAMLGKMKIAAWKLMGDVDKIETMLSDSDESVSQAAMEAMDGLVIAPQKKIAIFEKVLKGGYEYFFALKWAMNGIDKLVTDPQKIPILVNALNDNYSKEVQRWAMGEIDRLDKLVTDPQKIAIFEKVLKGGNVYSGSWAVEGLGQIGSEQAIKLIVSCLDDDGSYSGNYLTAMRTIDKVVTDPQKKFVIFEKAVGSKNYAVFKWAERGLEQIEKSNLETDPQKRFPFGWGDRSREDLLRLNVRMNLIHRRPPGARDDALSQFEKQAYYWALEGDDFEVVEGAQQIIIVRGKRLDHAMLAKVPDHLGGIALDARMLDLKIKRDGNGVPLPISQQLLDKINIQGFVPQIISIQPVDLPVLLGLNSQKE